MKQSFPLNLRLMDVRNTTLIMESMKILEKKKSDLYHFFIPLKRLFHVGGKKGSFAKNVFLFRLKNDLTGVKKLHFVCGG